MDIIKKYLSTTKATLQLEEEQSASLTPGELPRKNFILKSSFKASDYFCAYETICEIKVLHYLNLSMRYLLESMVYWLVH